MTDLISGQAQAKALTGPARTHRCQFNAATNIWFAPHPRAISSSVHHSFPGLKAVHCVSTFGGSVATGFKLYLFEASLDSNRTGSIRVVMSTQKHSDHISSGAELAFASERAGTRCRNGHKADLHRCITRQRHAHHPPTAVNPARRLMLCWKHLIWLGRIMNAVSLCPWDRLVEQCQTHCLSVMKT